jgi:hypothetical protein
MTSAASLSVVLQPLPWLGPGGGTRLSIFPHLVQQFFRFVLSDEEDHDVLRRSYIPAVSGYQMPSNASTPVAVPGVRNSFAAMRDVLDIALDEQPQDDPCWAFLPTVARGVSGSTVAWDLCRHPAIRFTTDLDDAFAAAASIDSQAALLAKAFETVCHAFDHLSLRYVGPGNAATLEPDRFGRTIRFSTFMPRAGTPSEMRLRCFCARMSLAASFDSYSVRFRSTVNSLQPRHTVTDGKLSLAGALKGQTEERIVLLSTLISRVDFVMAFPTHACDPTLFPFYTMSMTASTSSADCRAAFGAHFRRHAFVQGFRTGRNYLERAPASNPFAAAFQSPFVGKPSHGRPDSANPTTRPGRTGCPVPGQRGFPIHRARVRLALRTSG